MDLIDALQAFRMVAEESSFTRGADRCGVPQPVVSRRVAALERRLGGALLERSTRSVTLTELGPSRSATTRRPTPCSSWCRRPR